MAEGTITVKFGNDELTDIPANLSEAEIRETLAELKPEVANYNARWNADRTVLEFVPRPATKG
jgi:hypothetical protein